MANPYTWTTPITHRSSGSEMMTYVDMNRITTNLAWLYKQCQEIGITPAGSIISKTDWGQNDIITVTEWTEVLTCLTNVCNAIQYTPSEVAYENIPNMNHYIGDRWGAAYRYAGDPMNSGGRYD